jgi:hypothetical protein
MLFTWMSYIFFLELLVAVTWRPLMLNSYRNSLFSFPMQTHTTGNTSWEETIFDQSLIPWSSSWICPWGGLQIVGGSEHTLRAKLTLSQERTGRHSYTLACRLLDLVLACNCLLIWLGETFQPEKEQQSSTNLQLCFIPQFYPPKGCSWNF